LREHLLNLWPATDPEKCSQVNPNFGLSRALLKAFRFDKIETGVQTLDLTRFLDVNRPLPRIKSGTGIA
jgi:hypothetical protein